MCHGHIIGILIVASCTFESVNTLVGVGLCLIMVRVTFRNIGSSCITRNIASQKIWWFGLQNVM